MTTNAKDAVQSAFLQRQPIKMLIGGQWVEAASGETFETINPSTGEVLARVAAGANEDINRAVAAARKAFESGPWPQMTASQRGRLLLKLADLIEQNAEELAAGYFLRPTIFDQVRDDMTIAREEIFGPVVVALPFDDVEEVATRANLSIYGLAAGVWTSDIKKAHKMAAALKAGVIWVNTYNQFDAAAPFGGYKQSGYGREMGHAVLDAYTQIKTVWVNLR
jgi:acyl-CoA reductase-like NAD-dependent aldehyde dehydrogenase